MYLCVWMSGYVSHDTKPKSKPTYAIGDICSN